MMHDPKKQLTPVLAKVAIADIPVGGRVFVVASEKAFAEKCFAVFVHCREMTLF